MTESTAPPGGSRAPGAGSGRVVSAGGVTLCAACRRTSVCRLGLSLETLEDDGSVTTELVCDEAHEGGPGVAHGGWTAAALDEVSGHVVLQHGLLSVTKQLTVDFRRPVPLDRPLLASARRVSGTDSRWFVHAELTLAATGAVLATADAEMVLRTPSHFARFAAWLDEQDQQV